MTNHIDENGSSDSQYENHLECPDANTLAAYLDGTLSEKEQQLVDSHIQGCQRCREIVNLETEAQQEQVEHPISQTRNDLLDHLSQKMLPFSQLSTGKTIGRYIILKPLGLGGMGEVYSAYDPELNRRVALKLLRTDVCTNSKTKDYVTRLMKEAQAMAQLSHPNVISVFDVIKVDDQVVIAMEYFSGGTLKSWLEERPRSWSEIVDVFVLAGQGLAAAHVAKLVHRDFKPANVLLEADGRVCVTDFGLVRGLDQDELPKPLESLAPSNRWEESLTKTGAFMGTPAYMSPEQLLGEKSDTRSDQFGFCVALFEALYEKRPFSGATTKELKESILSGQISPIAPVKKVPAWLYDIIKRGLEVKPADRYQSMEDLLAKLKYDPEESARKKRAARNRKLLIISLVLLAIILPVGLWYGMRYRTVQLCKSAEGEFSGVWDEGTKASVRNAFLGIQKPYALSTWNRVEQNFDKYLTDWAQMRSDICEARWIRGTQSEELFDLRMSCLNTRKQELKALTKVFAKADSGVVGKAIQASSSLTGINICADEKAIRAPYPPPKTAELKASVLAIREKLTHVEAMRKTAKYQQGLELIKQIEEEANAVDYNPVRAEVLYWLGMLLYDNGEYKKAEDVLHDATIVAGESKDGLLAAKTMSMLVRVIGHEQSRYPEGLSIAQYANVLLDVAGGDDSTRADLLRNLGLIFDSQGKYDEAIQSYRRALVIYKKTLGSEHPKVADTLNSIGLVEKWQGKYDQALESYHRALAIWEKILEPENLLIASALAGIGNVFAAQGKPQQAIEPLERVAAICKKKTCEPEKHGPALFALARALVAIEGDKERAIKLAYQARTVFGISPKAFKKEQKEVNAWLKNNR